MIKTHQIFLAALILAAACLCIRLDSILFSDAIKNSEPNVTFFNESNIIGVKLSDHSGARQFFAGIQKRALGEMKMQNASDHPLKASIMKPGYKQRNYHITSMGVNIRMSLFSYRQLPDENKFKPTGEKDGITHLTYVYEKCNRNNIVLLSRDDMDSVAKVDPMVRFGILIQVLGR